MKIGLLNLDNRKIYLIQLTGIIIRFLQLLFSRLLIVVLICISSSGILVNSELKAEPSFKLSARSLQVGENGKSLVFIDNKVGINHDTPDAKLEIFGDGVTDIFQNTNFVINNIGSTFIGDSAASDTGETKYHLNTDDLYVSGNFTVKKNVGNTSVSGVTFDGETGDISSLGRITGNPPYFAINATNYAITAATSTIDLQSGATSTMGKPNGKTGFLKVEVAGYYLLGYTLAFSNTNASFSNNNNNSTMEIGFVKSEGDGTNFTWNNNDLKTNAGYSVLDSCIPTKAHTPYTSMGIHLLELGDYISFQLISGNQLEKGIKLTYYSIYGLYLGSDATFLNDFYP